MQYALQQVYGCVGNYGTGQCAYQRFHAPPSRANCMVSHPKNLSITADTCSMF